MPVQRDNPYGAFNFQVSLGGDQGSGDGGEVAAPIAAQILGSALG